MTIDVELEDIAMGEADLGVAARTIARCVAAIDDDIAHDLYVALRSWLWKALEARRRDDDLSGWLDLFGRVSSYLQRDWHLLAAKIDGFAELLQASIMVASAPRRRNLGERKHVREILSAVYAQGGRMKRQHLVAALNIKDANLTRVAAPMQDEGWIQREVVGRDVYYRLTEKGKAGWLPVIALEAKPSTTTPVRPLPPYREHVVYKSWSTPRRDSGAGDTSGYDIDMRVRLKVATSHHRTSSSVDSTAHYPQVTKFLNDASMMVMQ